MLENGVGCGGWAHRAQELGRHATKPAFGVDVRLARQQRPGRVILTVAAGRRAVPSLVALGSCQLPHGLVVVGLAK